MLNDFPVQQLGDTGAWVIMIQCMLKDIFRDSIEIHIDGDFGEETQNAVMALQRSNGITVDGIVGPAETWQTIIREWWCLK